LRGLENQRKLLIFPCPSPLSIPKRYAPNKKISKLSHWLDHPFEGAPFFSYFHDECKRNHDEA